MYVTHGEKGRLPAHKASPGQGALTSGSCFQNLPSSPLFLDGLRLTVCPAGEAQLSEAGICVFPGWPHSLLLSVHSHSCRVDRPVEQLFLWWQHGAGPVTRRAFAQRDCYSNMSFPSPVWSGWFHWPWGYRLLPPPLRRHPHSRGVRRKRISGCSD